jgi:hypothetical protein
MSPSETSEDEANEEIDDDNDAALDDDSEADEDEEWGGVTTPATLPDSVSLEADSIEPDSSGKLYRVFQIK